MGILNSALITYWVKYKGTRFPIRRGETILGRSPYCSIVITDDLVSREHCALRLTGEGLVVSDLNSTNGLRLNGVELRGTSRLKAGDVLHVGTAVLEVMEVDASVRSRARSTTRSNLEREVPPPDEPRPSLTQANTLDLISTLLASPAAGPHLEAVGATVRRALEDLLEGLKTERSRQGATPALAETSAVLMGLANRTAELFPDGSYAEWNAQYLSDLEALL